MSHSRMNSDSYKKNLSLSKMLRNGVIMDVTNVEQAKIAEDSGACAVMALERVPSQIRAEGGVARMSDPKMIMQIKESVSIPVMAKARIGHISEARILEAIGVDFIDESEVLTPADNHHHIDKFDFKVPFVCGCKNLGEALRRINEGAVMIRTKGEAGTGDIVEAVKHMRTLIKEINIVKSLKDDEIYDFAKVLAAPYDLVKKIKDEEEFLVPNFSAGGVAIPADAALMMTLGAESVFVGSGIFNSENPLKMAKAIVDAVSHYDNPKKLLEISTGIGNAMRGISVDKISDNEKMSYRGW